MLIFSYDHIEYMCLPALIQISDFINSTVAYISIHVCIVMLAYLCISIYRMKTRWSTFIMTFKEIVKYLIVLVKHSVGNVCSLHDR